MFRLCLALGFPHPDFLLSLLTPDQLRDWTRFYDIEPWGFESVDYQFGWLRYQIATALGTQDTTLNDYLWAKKLAAHTPVTPEENERLLSAKIHAIFGPLAALSAGKALPPSPPMPSA